MTRAPVSQPSAPKPLAGIKVIDLTSVIFGPLAAQVLADYGADVIKVEPPEGDSTRRTGPAKEADMAGSYLGSNRNKRSVVLDLKRPEAQQALLAMVRQADVFMHNIRPQKLDRIGISVDAVMACNPRLVYASLTGFGEGGPYSGLPAYDDIIQGMSGMASLMQRQSGEMRYFPTVAADKTSGLAVANAILAAIVGRERAGQGCHVEIPMFESMVAFNLVEHMQGQHFDPPMSPIGYARVLAPSRRPYATSDGYVCMMPYSDENWRNFFTEVGRPDIAADPRFQGIANRTRNISELLQYAASFIAKRGTAYWIEICSRHEIPAAPVAGLDDLLNDPHLVQTAFFEHVEDAALGRVVFPGIAARFNGSRLPVSMPPRLGQHTREVLAETGLPREEVHALLAGGAAVQHPRFDASTAASATTGGAASNET